MLAKYSLIELRQLTSSTPEHVLPLSTPIHIT